MAAPQVTAKPPFWMVPAGELLRSLETGAAGLDSAEAAGRLLDYGPNSVAAPRRRWLTELGARFANPLMAILLFAAAVSGATGDMTGFVLIVTLVALSVVLDFVQEHRAERAAEALRRSMAIRATVLRDGQFQELPADRLVPGDVVRLSAGDLVPADGRVLSAKDLFVNQALMTGEPYPVEKRTNDVTAREPAAASNAVFAGTSIVSGTATAVVAATGRATAFGEIAAGLATTLPPTAFEREMRRLGVLILRVTVFLVLFVLLVNAVADRPLIESFLFAIALAVGLTPELLPMIVTVTLSRGALRMASKRVIVKRLASIHNLGGMDVLCTDKTGTLTEAKIALIRHVDAAGRDSDHVFEIAYLNSHFESGLKSPLDDAILAHRTLDVSNWHKIDEVPFDFERRRVSVLADDGQRRMLLVKGAPEDILRLAECYEEDGPTAIKTLDDSARDKLRQLHDALAQDGFRVLGIAWRAVERDHATAVVDDESALVFAGFAAFLDPPKATAAEGIAVLARAGIAVKIVTGDNELVTRHLCGALALERQVVLTGAEIAKLDDTALAARVEDTDLFCRVTPAQKTRILRALQARGHTVGFMGDGINDAPALRAADVGISVDSAVDVAKAAADLILLEPDLRVLGDGVAEGRRTFANIMKYVRMGTSSNFGNMVSMAGASVLLPFLPMLPVQILLNNFLYDLSEIGIPLDHVDRDDLDRPRRWDMRALRDFMMVMGTISSLFDFLTFGVMLYVFDAGPALFQTGWFLESMATQILVIFVIRTRGNPLRSRPHPGLVVSSLAALAVAIAIPFTPLGPFFGFVLPPANVLTALTAMVAAYLAAAALAQRYLATRRTPLPNR